MEASENSILKIYTSSTDKFGTQLFYEHIVYLAKERGISGVTVYRGIMGYGSSNKQISSSKFWELTEKLPVVIEIIDKTPVLESFFRMIEQDLKKIPKGCLVALEPVKVLFKKAGRE